MRLLLDSSGRYLICALAGEEGVFAEEQHPTGSSQSRDIGTVVGRLLDGIPGAILTEVVVGLGPGSFIGTRVAISYANGLAAAGGLALRGVASLEAILAVHGTGRAVVWRDARRQQVYWCGPGAGGTTVELVAVEELARQLAAHGIEQVVIEHPGDDRHSEQMRLELTEQAARAGASIAWCAGVPAEGLRRLAGSRPPAGYVEPVYLRGFL